MKTERTTVLMAHATSSCVLTGLFPTDGKTEDKTKQRKQQRWGRKMPHNMWHSTEEAYLICKDQSMTKAKEHYE